MRSDRMTTNHRIITTGNVPGIGYLYDPRDSDPLLVLKHSAWLPKNVRQRGLYTTRDIPYVLGQPRKPITQYAGVVVTKDKNRTASETAYWRGIGFDTVIDGFKDPRDGYGMAQYCNDPYSTNERIVNCEIKPHSRDNTIQILYPLEKVSIQAGDELCIDYGSLYWQRIDDELKDREYIDLTGDNDDDNSEQVYIETTESSEDDVQILSSGWEERESSNVVGTLDAHGRNQSLRTAHSTIRVDPNVTVIQPNVRLLPL